MKWFISVLGILFFGNLFSQIITFNELDSIKSSTIDIFEVNDFGEILVNQHGKGLLKSNDTGANWQRIESNLHPYDYGLALRTIKDAPDGSFYLLHDGTLAKLSPSSSKMVDIESSTIGRIMAFAINIEGHIYILNDSNEIWESLDDGENWQLITAIPATGPLISIDGFISKFLTDGYLYMALMSSTDGTQSLYRIDTENGEIVIASEPNNYVPMDGLEIHQSGKYLLTRNRELLISDSGFDNWTDILSAQSFGDIYKTVVHENGEIVLFTQTGAYSSLDLGINWKSHPIALSNNSFLSAIVIYDKVNSKYFTTINSGLIHNLFSIEKDFSNIQGILAEENGAKILSIKEDVLGRFYIKLGFLDARLGTSGGYLRADSKEAGFTQFSIEDSDHKIRELAIGDNSTFFAVGSKRNELFRSDDDGMNWTEIQPAGVSIIFGQTHVRYANKKLVLFSDGVWLSEDKGDSWIKIYDELLLERETFLSSDGNIYIIDDAFLIRYNISSQTLDTIYQSNRNIESILIANDKAIIINNDGEILYSFDGGNSFIENPKHQFTKIISSELGYLVGFTEEEIFISYTDGFLWSYAGENPAEVLTAAYIDKSNFLYVGESSGYLKKSTTPLFFNNAISGNVFNDENVNCIIETNEKPIPRIIISATDNNEYFGVSDANGDYFIPVPPGTFIVEPNLDVNLWDLSCSVPAQVTLNGSDITNIDFPASAIIDCPRMRVDLTTPMIRRCFENTHYISYFNEGTTAADNVLIQVEMDPRFSITSSSINFTIINSGTYEFDIGTVESYEGSNFSFSTVHPCDSVDLGETICMEAHVYPDSICVPPLATWSGASLEINGECDGDSVRFSIKNIGTGDMIQARQYIIIEDVAIMRITDPIKLPSGEEHELDAIFADGRTFHIEIPQVDGHPGNSQPSLTIESCGSPPHNLGLFNQFGQNDNDPHIDIECREVRGAYDPNDKSAVPVGLDVEHKIQPDRSIEYLIRFQNTGTDTAFTVRILDTLSNWLDVTTFTAGASSHDYTYEISDQGTIYFIFNNIMLPDSNINEPASNGFVKYKIAMKTDLPLGTEILNKADIYFDFNDPIRTNETFHVIDEPWVLVKTSEVFLPKTEVKVYPNPFNETAILELKSDSFKSEFNCRIFDLNSKVISSQISDNQKITLTRNNLNSGIYFYQLIGKNGKIASGKVVIK